MTNRLSTGVFIGHCPLRNVNYDVVSVCEMKTIFPEQERPNGIFVRARAYGKNPKAENKRAVCYSLHPDLFPNQPKVSHVRLRFKAAHSLPPRKKRR